MSSMSEEVRQQQKKITALIRENADLKEQLRVEGRKRETAVQKGREHHAALREAEREIKQLQYANRKLTQELVELQEGAREASARNR
jgi:predicted transcriptional regulator